VHNRSWLDVDVFCKRLQKLGYKSEYDSRVSRTIVWSDAPKSVVDNLHNKMFDEEVA
jgi:hypothetical protein